jgi:hypothetical protein
LSGVGSSIRKLETDFDPRTYGYKKLSELVGAIGLFKIKKVDKLVFIRDAGAKRAVSVGGGLQLVD